MPADAVGTAGAEEEATPVAARITAAVAARIERLLAEGHPRRGIARIVGISRGTVDGLAAGSVPTAAERSAREEAKRHPTDRPDVSLERCPGCGGLVLMPCRVCRIRNLLSNGSRRLKAAYPPDVQEHFPGIDLQGASLLRYQRLHRFKKNN